MASEELDHLQIDQQMDQMICLSIDHLYFRGVEKCKKNDV